LGVTAYVTKVREGSKKDGMNIGQEKEGRKETEEMIRNEGRRACN